MKPLGIVTGLAAEAAIVEQAALQLGQPRPKANLDPPPA